MRSGRAQGYMIIVDPDGPTVERDNFRCNHCGCIVFVDPGKDPTTYGGWCGGCAKLICPKCEERKARTLTCATIDARIEQIERAWETKRSIAAVLD